ncbi:MAG: RNA repair domain-containing protein [Candidatus Hadarchaeales archaeon]
MQKPRDILNKLKWHERNLERAKITILHRGAANDQKVISGAEIISLSRGYMVVQSAGGELEIPYHRILQIEVDGKMIWSREFVRKSKKSSWI